MIRISEDEAADITRLVEKCENLAAASLIPMPASFHVTQLREGLTEISSALRSWYRKATGEDPWQEP